jgi:hypothetical protein
MKNSCTVDTVNAVAKMRKLCTVDTVNGNSHTVDTVVSAMKNACKDVSYSKNSHILEMNSGSEAHTDHDLILGSEHDKISYIIKTLNYTQKMMKKFLNMRSSTKTANSVDLRQCKKISRDLGISRDLDELHQDQVIQITNEMKFYLKQSSTNQRGVTDRFCRHAKYEHFRSGKHGHFGPDKDEFYMPGK